MVGHKHAAVLLAMRMPPPFQDTQYEYHQIVKPLDQNKISRLGRLAKRAIFFAIDLPSNYAGSIEYSSYIRLFLPNDARQSIVDYPVHVQSPPSIVVDFLPLSSSETLGRAVRVSIRQLCASYIEVKAIVYSDLVTKVTIVQLSLSLDARLAEFRRRSRASNATSTRTARLRSISCTDNVRFCSINFNRSRTTRSRFVRRALWRRRRRQPRTSITMKLDSSPFKRRAACPTVDKYSSRFTNTIERYSGR